MLSRDSDNSEAGRTVDPLLTDYNENVWFGGDNGRIDDAINDGQATREINLLHGTEAMGNLETLLSESHKFLRMADDLHDVARYLNDMRMCFIAITVTSYIVLVIYGILFCVRRNRRRPAGLNNNGTIRRTRWDYQVDNRDPQTHLQTDDLVSVRSDGQGIIPSYMGRSQRSAPSFMRHSMNHSQQTARLRTDSDGVVIKQQLPQIKLDSLNDNINSPSKTSELKRTAIDM